MENLPNDSKARARYAALIVALGMEAEALDPQHAATLARLAAWTADLDVDTLAYLIRRARGAASSRMGALVREVAEQIDRKHPASSGDWAVIALPTGLVTRIQEAAR